MRDWLYSPMRGATRGDGAICEYSDPASRRGSDAASEFPVVRELIFEATRAVKTVHMCKLFA